MATTTNTDLQQDVMTSSAVEEKFKHLKFIVISVVHQPSYAQDINLYRKKSVSAVNLVLEKNAMQWFLLFSYVVARKVKMALLTDGKSDDSFENLCN